MHGSSRGGVLLASVGKDFSRRLIEQATQATQATQAGAISLFSNAAMAAVIKSVTFVVD